MSLPEDFKTYLQQELVSRVQKNPSYSLRAFANSLEINHSGLSQILSGKRAISEKMIKRLGEKLDFGPREYDHFLEKKEKAQEINYSAEQLSLDSFEVISDWHHLAILELMDLVNYKNDFKWMASKLGLSVHEIRLAFERMQRLKLVELVNGDYKKTHLDGVSCVHHTFTNTAKKKYQKQVFTKALEAISETDINQRSHSGMTMAIDSRKLDLARKEILEFRRRLNDLLSTEQCDEVYHLSIGLFPLTNTKQNIEHAGDES